MDWVYLALAGLALFLCRDILLFASGRRTLAPVRGATYAAATMALFALLGRLAESMAQQQAAALLRDPRFWGSAVLIHLVLLFATLRLRRSEGAIAKAWVLAVIPTPMFVFSAGGVCWLVLQKVSRVEGGTAGALVGLAATVAVLGPAWLLGRFRISPFKAIEFASGVNLTAILLIPLNQTAGDGPARQEADLVYTVIPLALTAGMIGLSYAWHRRRNFPMG